jgi:hypothetical protein
MVTVGIDTLEAFFAIVHSCQVLDNVGFAFEAKMAGRASQWIVFLSKKGFRLQR